MQVATKTAHLVEDNDDMSDVLALLGAPNDAVSLALLNKSEKAASNGQIAKSNRCLVSAVNEATSRNSIIGATPYGVVKPQPSIIAFTGANGKTPYALTLPPDLVDDGKSSFILKFDNITLTGAVTRTAQVGDVFTGSPMAVVMPISNDMVSKEVSSGKLRVFPTEIPPQVTDMDKRDFRGIKYSPMTSKNLVSVLDVDGVNPPTDLVLCSLEVTTGQVNKSSDEKHGKAYARLQSSRGCIMAISRDSPDVETQLKSCVLNLKSSDFVEKLLNASRAHNTELVSDKFVVDEHPLAYFTSEFTRKFHIDSERFPIKVIAVVQGIASIQVSSTDVEDISYKGVDGTTMMTVSTDSVISKLPGGHAMQKSDILVLDCSVVIWPHGSTRKRKLTDTEVFIKSAVFFINKRHMYDNLGMNPVVSSGVSKPLIYDRFIDYVKASGVLAEEFRNHVNPAQIHRIVPRESATLSSSGVYPDDLSDFLFDVKPREPSVTHGQQVEQAERILQANPNAPNAAGLMCAQLVGQSLSLKFDVKMLTYDGDSYFTRLPYDIADAGNVTLDGRISMLSIFGGFQLDRVSDVLIFQDMDKGVFPYTRSDVYAAWMATQAMARCGNSSVNDIVKRYVYKKDGGDAMLNFIWEATSFFVCLTAAVDKVALETVANEDRDICIEGYSSGVCMFDWAKTEARKVHMRFRARQGTSSHIEKFSDPAYFLHLWDIGLRIEDNLKSGTGKTYEKIVEEAGAAPDPARVVVLKAYFAALWADHAEVRAATSSV